MSVECQFNLKQIVGIVFERSKINNNFKFHKEIRRKYILFGEKIIKRFWTDYYFGIHHEYSEDEIKEKDQFMIIGDTIFYRPSIRIMFANDKKFIYYFDNDFKAEKAYNEIIKQMEEKIPICDIEKICRTYQTGVLV